MSMSPLGREAMCPKSSDTHLLSYQLYNSSARETTNIRVSMSDKVSSTLYLLVPKTTSGIINLEPSNTVWPSNSGSISKSAVVT